MSKKKVLLTLLVLPVVIPMWLIGWVIVVLAEPKEENERTRSDKVS